MNYVFHPAAESEHLETVAYYESKRPGLGAEYLAEFEAAMGGVCQFPHRYPIAFSADIRRKRMERFPFAILYREQVGIVQVLAVAHLRRRPDYWLGRC
ncbi:type II toxin-antitoxin system RelE/ParE family toxin [Endothiovibrio diazotrophicus]